MNELNASKRPNKQHMTMAKFRTSIFFAAALLCFFTVSLARTTPDNDDVTTTQVALPLPSADPALRLPIETDLKANTETEITFRPVNRRFQMRPKRPCRHHFRFYPRGNDDMILSSGENSDFEQPMEGRRIRGRWMRTQIRRRQEDSDSDSDEEEDHDEQVKKALFKRYVYDRFDREKKLKKLRKHFRVRNVEAEKKKKKRSGLMRGVRKFLDRYI